MKFAHKMKVFFNFLMYKVLVFDASTNEDIQKIEDALKRDRTEVLKDYLAVKFDGPTRSAQLGTLDEEIQELTRQILLPESHLGDILEVYEILLPIYSNICDIEQLDKALLSNAELKEKVYTKKELVHTIQGRSNKETKILKKEFKG
jgi:hypothetical protein